uniref:Uncharacterized protein n=1 Tax=Rhizophora mucronata TaxID=61149 RepID=A0A2P2QSN6_RHIMU
MYQGNLQRWGSKEVPGTARKNLRKKADSLIPTLAGPLVSLRSFITGIKTPKQLPPKRTKSWTSQVKKKTRLEMIQEPIKRLQLTPLDIKPKNQTERGERKRKRSLRCSRLSVKAL